MINTIPSIGAQIFDNVLSLSLSIIKKPSIPLNVILYNGIPLTYNGIFLTYN